MWTRREFMISIGCAAAGTIGFGALPAWPGSGSISIGTLAPMTGSLAAFGPYLSNASVLAQDHINSAGGPLGKELKLIQRDSQTDPIGAVDAVTKLVTIDKVPAIVGGFSSGVTLAAAGPVIDNEVVMICTAATSPQVTFLDDNDFIFRATIANDAKGVAQAKVANAAGYKKISAIYVNNAYGLALAEHFEKELKRLGGSVPASVPYDKGKPSYASEIEKVIKGDPEAVFLIGYVEDGITILRQMISLGFEGQLILGDGMKSEDVIQKVGAKYVDGAYDATIAIALAIQRAGSATGPAIRDNLRKVTNSPGEKVTCDELKKAFDLLKSGKEINYQGASGVFDFDEYGSTFTAIEIWKIEGEAFKTVKKSDFAEIPATLTL